MLNNLKKKDGFTLAEILIVLAVVAVIATGTIAVLRPIFGSGRVNAAASSISNLKNNALVYSNSAGDSFSTVSIANMVSADILGPNWNNETGCTPGADISGIHHCNPWGGAYEIAAGSLNPSSTFTVSLTGVPEKDAYNIASQFWNQDDNDTNDTGGTSGIEFIPNGGAAVWMSQSNPSVLTTAPGTLTIYFGY